MFVGERKGKERKGKNRTQHNTSVTIYINMLSVLAKFIGDKKETRRNTGRNERIDGSSPCANKGTHEGKGDEDDEAPFSYTVYESVCNKFVCMHVCMYVYVYVRTCVCMYACMCTCMFVHVCMHVCMYVYVYVRTCVYACMQVCVRVCSYMCVCTNVFVCIYVRYIIYVHRSCLRFCS